MPVLSSSYRAPFWLRNGHTNTIIAKLQRTPKPLGYNRERIITPDNDFLDLDRVMNNNSRVAILLHGLEGSSCSGYMLTTSKHLSENNWDVVCLNLRGCSGEPNALFSSYHSGKSDDLSFVVECLQSEYESIAIVGFSLGGNIVLKYAGETGFASPQTISHFVGVSVPCDLKGSAEMLKKRSRKVYMNRFLRTMKEKANHKLRKHGSLADENAIMNSKSFHDFDNAYTAPAHGFKDVFDYWDKCNSKQFLLNISKPTFLLNAKDDPFLSESCFPYKEAEENENLYLETPKTGGHLGFLTSTKSTEPGWLENRILSFINSKTSDF